MIDLPLAVTHALIAVFIVALRWLHPEDIRSREDLPESGMSGRNYLGPGFVKRECAYYPAAANDVATGGGQVQLADSRRHGAG